MVCGHAFQDAGTVNSTDSEVHDGVRTVQLSTRESHLKSPMGLPRARPVFRKKGSRSENALFRRIEAVASRRYELPHRGADSLRAQASGVGHEGRGEHGAAQDAVRTGESADGQETNIAGHTRISAPATARTVASRDERASDAAIPVSKAIVKCDASLAMKSIDAARAGSRAIAGCADLP